MLEMHEYLTITVSLHDREDGGLRVYSDDLPGLILSGPDSQRVIEAVVPAISAILDQFGFQDFEIHPSKSVVDIMNGDNPQHVDMHIKQFVVEYRRAA